MAPLFRSKAYDNGWKYPIWIINTLIFLGVSDIFLRPGSFNEVEFTLFLIITVGIRLFCGFMNKKVADKEGEDFKTSDW